MLSPCHPCVVHVVPIAPRRSPCGLHGCGLRCLHPMLSPWSPCCPRCPCIVPVSPSSPHCPHSAQKVPMWSPWLWSPWSPLYVVPMVSVSSPSSPCRPRHPHIVEKVPTSSLTPPRYPLHPPPTPWGVGGPESVKMQ